MFRALAHVLNRKKTMKSIQKIMTASAALSALAFVAFASPAAQAGEDCSTNTSGMRGCGFATLEQCKASMSGITGTCDRAIRSTGIPRLRWPIS
jgi:uncharacterized membrane protein